MNRYARQEAFPGIGPEGQARLRASRVVVIGCGALGSSSAETLARAGVGTLVVVDRDIVEETNLQRQSMFEESDVAEGLPKAVAAARHLRRLNSEVDVQGVVADVDAGNVLRLLAGADVVVDGSDNFETRFLLNDACVRAGVPWVYGACVAAYGLAMVVRPRLTPCLQCVLEEMPAPGSGPTCETAGIIAPIARVIAGIQAAETLKLLAGRTEALLGGIVTVDLWKNTFDVMDLRDRGPSCPACIEARFTHLERTSSTAETLCGRNAVHVRPQSTSPVDLEVLAGRLGVAGTVTANEHLLRFTSEEAELVVFRDGRAIIRGVADPARARALYARFVGI